MKSSIELQSHSIATGKVPLLLEIFIWTTVVKETNNQQTHIILSSNRCGTIIVANLKVKNLAISSAILIFGTSDEIILTLVKKSDLLQVG